MLFRSEFSDSELYQTQTSEQRDVHDHPQNQDQDDHEQDASHNDDDDDDDEAHFTIRDSLHGSKIKHLGPLQRYEATIPAHLVTDHFFMANAELALDIMGKNIEGATFHLVPGEASRPILPALEGRNVALQRDPHAIEAARTARLRAA